MLWWIWPLIELAAVIFFAWLAFAFLNEMIELHKTVRFWMSEIRSELVDIKDYLADIDLNAK